MPLDFSDNVTKVGDVFIFLMNKSLFKTHTVGVPIVAQQVKDRHGVSEDAYLIPVLAQWAKDPVFPQAVV